MVKSEELTKDLEELNLLLGQATRQRIKDILLLAQTQLQNDLRNAKLSEKSPSSSNNDHVKRRCIVDLTEYAWDESDKYVKIFATLNGVQKLDVTDVETQFTDNSVQLLIKNLNDKDYCLKINNLLLPIDVEQCYHKIKTDMVVVFMKKKEENKKWSFLTSTEKRLKEVKDAAFKPDDMDEDLKDDPSAGIMNLMKKMYQSGDAEMKRTIAKAWTESQEKNKKMEL